MLRALKGLFSRSEKCCEPESQPLCLVAVEEDSSRECLAALVGEQGLQTETFSNVVTMTAAAGKHQPDLVLLDTGFPGVAVGDALRALATLPKKPAVQLITGLEVRTYEQICAVGQAKFSGEQAGLKMLTPLPLPFQPDAVRKMLQGLGLLRKAGKPALTLRQALDNGWLDLWYQPKVELANGRLVGAEGLIRARHPEFGVLSPIAFLPGAGEAEMLQMTEQVILAALRDFDDFAVLGAPVMLSVNTPVSALTTLPIAAMLRQSRPKSELWPGLMLEVTEDEVVNDPDLANNVAEEVRAHSCFLAIDDFGAGYSSLSRLRQLPFSELKIDRSYVTNCDHDRTNAGLCETIVELAKRFGLTTVAEGVETIRESHKLQAIGCHVGQGYLFSKPLSKPDFIAALRRRMAHRSEASTESALRQAAALRRVNA